MKFSVRSDHVRQCVSVFGPGCWWVERGEDSSGAGRDNTGGSAALTGWAAAALRCGAVRHARTHAPLTFVKVSEAFD